MEFYPGTGPENTQRRERSCSLPPPSRTHNPPTRGRRQSLVLTPKILDEYSKVEEESVSFQKKYDTAHYYVYGSHVRQKSVESSWPVDSTVYTHYKSDPCLAGMGFFDSRKISLTCITSTDKVSS